jgi:hypothetical protein
MREQERLINFLRKFSLEAASFKDLYDVNIAGLEFNEDQAPESNKELRWAKMLDISNRDHGTSYIGHHFFLYSGTKLKSLLAKRDKILISLPRLQKKLGIDFLQAFAQDLKNLYHSYPFLKASFTVGFFAEDLKVLLTELDLVHVWVISSENWKEKKATIGYDPYIMSGVVFLEALQGHPEYVLDLSKGYFRAFVNLSTKLPPSDHVITNYEVYHTSKDKEGRPVQFDPPSNSSVENLCYFGRISPVSHITHSRDFTKIENMFFEWVNAHSLAYSNYRKTRNIFFPASHKNSAEGTFGMPYDILKSVSYGEEVSQTKKFVVFGFPGLPEVDPKHHMPLVTTDEFIHIKI